MKDVNATVMIDLKNIDEEALFNNIEHSRRKNIKKSQREELIFEEPKSEKEIKQAYKIYSDVWIEGGATPETYEEFSEKAKDKNFKFFVLKKKQRVIGSAIIQKVTKKYYSLENNSKGILFHAFSSDRKFSDLRPNDALYWNSILFAFREKLDFVDLGGWQINSRGHLKGINRFKEQWGGKIFYYYKDYSFLRALGRKLIRNIPFFWWLNKKFKGRK